MKQIDSLHILYIMYRCKIYIKIVNVLYTVEKEGKMFCILYIFLIKIMMRNQNCLVFHLYIFCFLESPTADSTLGGFGSFGAQWRLI